MYQGYLFVLISITDIFKPSSIRNFFAINALYRTNRKINILVFKVFYLRSLTTNHFLVNIGDKDSYRPIFIIICYIKAKKQLI